MIGLIIEFGNLSNGNIFVWSILLNSMFLETAIALKMADRNFLA